MTQPTEPHDSQDADSATTESGRPAPERTRQAAADTSPDPATESSPSAVPSSGALTSSDAEQRSNTERDEAEPSAAPERAGAESKAAESRAAESRAAESKAEATTATADAAVPSPESESADVAGYAGNGKPEPAPVSLPPPWQRANAGTQQPVASRSDASGSVATDAGRPAETTGRTDLGSARTVSLQGPTPPPDDEPPGATPPPGNQSAPVTPPGGFPMSWPRNRRPRQASLQLKRLDPWSVLKIALVLAVVLYLVWLVAVGVLYGALDGIGVWERLNGQYADLVAEQADDRLISAGRVFGVAAVIGAVNSLLFAVALSVGAFVYNVSSDLVGGIEVTLSERD